MTTTKPYTDTFYVLGRLKDGTQEYLYFNGFGKMSFCYNETHAFMSRDIKEVKLLKERADKSFSNLYIGKLEMIHRISEVLP